MGFRRRLIWLAVLTGVAVAEVALLVYGLIGPLRFEHHGLALAASVARVVPANVAIALPGAVVRRVDAGGLYDHVFDAARSGGIDSAAARYADALASTAGSNLPVWIREQAPHDWVESAWQACIGQDCVEVGWVTSDAFEGRGLYTADAFYRLEVQQGRIVAQCGDLTSTTKAWLVGSRSIMAIKGWPSAAGRVMLATLVASFVGGCAWLFLATPRSRRTVAGSLVLIPLLTGLTFTLVDPSGSSLANLLPDGPLYRTHAALATVAEHLGDANGAALQWVKAASHARLPADAIEASEGIARVNPQISPDVYAALCTQWQHGAPWTRDAMTRAGMQC